MRYYNNQMIDGDDGSHPFSPYYVEVESDAPKCDHCDSQQEVKCWEYVDIVEDEDADLPVKEKMLCYGCKKQFEKTVIII